MEEVEKQKKKDTHFTMIPNYIMFSNDPSNMIRVLGVIAAHAWKGSACTASMDTIRCLAKTSRGTVFKAIKLWERRGQIRVDRSNPWGLRIVTTFNFQFDYKTDAPWVTTKREKRNKRPLKIVPEQAPGSAPINIAAVPGAIPSQLRIENLFDSPPDTATVPKEEHKEDQEEKENKHTQQEQIKIESLGCVSGDIFSKGQVGEASAEAEKLCLLFVSLDINTQITCTGFRRDAEECLADSPFQYWSDLLHRYAKCKSASEKQLDRWLPLIRSPKEMLQKHSGFIAYEKRRKESGMAVYKGPK